MAGGGGGNGGGGGGGDARKRRYDEQGYNNNNFGNPGFNNNYGGRRQEQGGFSGRGDGGWQEPGRYDDQGFNGPYDGRGRGDQGRGGDLGRNGDQGRDGDSGRGGDQGRSNNPGRQDGGSRPHLLAGDEDRSWAAAEDGPWGPPPPWWEQEQARKRKAEAARARGAPAQTRGGGGGHGGGSHGNNSRNRGQTQGASSQTKPKGKGKQPGGTPTATSDGERWNRHRRNDKTGKANDTQPGQDGGSTGGSGKTTRAAAPGSRSAPPLGKITDQYGPNLDCLPGLSLSRMFEALADLDRPETGDKVLDTPMDASLPGLEESLASGETISHVSDPVDAWLLDSPTGLVSDTVAPGAELLPTELDLRGEVIAAISLSQGKRTKVVTVPASPRTTKKTTAVGAVRKSSRNQGPAANLPVLEKAKMLTKAKNLDPPSSGLGINPFAALPSLSDSHISSVIVDSCIVFVPSAGSREEAISLLRAKEQVQAALAEAAAEKARQASVLVAREAVEDTSNTPGEGGADPSDALDLPAEAGIGKASSPPAHITRSMSRSKRSTRPLLTARKGRGMKLQGKP
ncbi:hypothetical protein ACQ4PT_015831 [Festuca glaucescens]